MLAPLGVPREEALEVLSLGGLGLRLRGLAGDRLEELIDAGELPRKLHALSEAASQGGWWQGCGAAYKPTRIVMHTASNVSIFQP